MASGDTKHLTQLFTVGGEAMQIGMDFSLGDDIGTNTSLADDWMAAFAPIANLLSNELLNAGVRVADVSSTPQVSVLVTPSGGQWTAGGVVEHSIPSASAVVVTKYSAFRGKQHRGRFYLPGLPQSQQDGGILQPTPLANLQSAIGTFLGAISTATASGNVYTPEVFSYVGVPHGPNRVPSGIVAIVRLNVTRVLRQQRRREIGVSRRGRRRTV